jgi:cytochrome c peroxidase
MHDGAIATLEDAVRHHFAGSREDPRLKHTVSDDEVAALVAFLESLTDEGFAASPKFSMPPATCPLPADQALTEAEANAAALHNSPPGP